MGLWDDRAPEIESMRQRNATNAQIAAKYGVSVKTFKNQLALLRAKGLIGKAEPVKPGPKPAADAESIDYNADGSYSSQKPLWMTLEQVKDPEYLLRAHGFEPDKWELVSSRNKIWNGYSKQDGIVTLYSSSIHVKPKVQGWTFDDLVDAIQNIHPVHVLKFEDAYRERMIEVPLFDMHWGISDLELYQPTQTKIYHLLASREWEQTLFVVGQDLFHVDNFKNTTANGTPIEGVNIPQAWQDCANFYEPLIEAALEHSGAVHVIYSSGNHDSSMGWCFVQYLKARFPQCQFDDRVKERKVHVFGRNFIGITHGDKARKDLIRIFPAEFPLEWSKTTTRECHIGHLHREDEIRGKDEFGLTIRTLATRNRTDQYHDDNGYVTAHKRFMLFEYSSEQLESIHYV